MLRILTGTCLPASFWSSLPRRRGRCRGGAEDILILQRGRRRIVGSCYFALVRRNITDCAQLISEQFGYCTGEDSDKKRGTSRVVLIVGVGVRSGCFLIRLPTSAPFPPTTSLIFYLNLVHPPPWLASSPSRDREPREFPSAGASSPLPPRSPQPASSSCKKS